MKSLDSELLKELLARAADQLEGKWLLLGGTLLPALGLDVRSTVDVDLVSLERTGPNQTLRLMELAETLGLPVETINQAAAFFLEKAGYTEDDLILLRKGKSAVIYRPTVELYWKLKIPRLTESDLLDCQHYFHYSKGQKNPFDEESLRALVELALQGPSSPERVRRLEQLLAIVSGNN